MSSAHRKNNWKVAQKNTKIKKKTKLALLVLGLIVFLLVLGQTVRIIQSLSSPFSKDVVKVSRSYQWDNDFNLNLVIKTKGVYLLSYNPSEKRITVIDVPDEAYLEVPGGFGEWQLRSIYDLGQTSQGPGGGELLKRSLSSFFGIPVDGFIEFKGQLAQKSGVEVADFLRQNPLNIAYFLSSITSDLTPWELIRLKLAFSQVRFDKVQDIDLKKLKLMETDRLGDGTQILTADPTKIDSALINFIDTKIREEHLGVAIFNATSYPGLAQKAARIITNTGGNVIMTTNANLKQPKTVVLGEESATLKRLSQIFSSDCKKALNCDRITCNPGDKDQENCLIEDPGIKSSRAQINVVLGEDFYLTP